MKQFNQLYINGEFVKPHGTQVIDLISPITGEKMSEVMLGDEVDTKHAIASAKTAFATYRHSTIAERIAYLENFKIVLEKRRQDLETAMTEEYGGTPNFVPFIVDVAIHDVQVIIDLIKDYPFVRQTEQSTIVLQPVGVVGVITPWNASTLFVVSKVSMALAAGCTCVIKPSELSARQTQVLMECFDEIGLPKGVVNFVNGLGAVVGDEITKNPDINKITFTGSTGVGKTIARGAVESMKRVTLELGGKSPNIILDDANLDETIPMAILSAFMNNGQACVAATRLLVPANKLAEVNAIAKDFVENQVKVGDPRQPDTTLGPAVSQTQYDRVQEYIRIGIEEDKAELLVGGLGRPQGLTAGNFTQATIFTNVNNNMRIAREEIFGPVLCIIPYTDEAQAVQIANDTQYGLAAYVSGNNRERALRVASQLDAGQVKINNPFAHDNIAPFGGMKQSGIGREFGEFGISAYLEPKTITG
ncbi:aldehyde dehydrogenase [Pasteurellaceae bacterium Pebbles2]|nr:aldehyde dehydrogenase [Pasteurellaceae bacterium Pebbles2]